MMTNQKQKASRKRSQQRSLKATSQNLKLNQLKRRKNPIKKSQKKKAKKLSQNQKNKKKLRAMSQIQTAMIRHQKVK